MKISALIPAGVLAVLAACSSGVEAPNTQEVLIQAARGAIFERPAPPQTLSRAQLEQLGMPIMEARVEQIGQAGYIAALTEQTDSLGKSTTWKSSDKVSFTFRNGVLIATRGTGFDLISASAPVANGGTMGPAYSGSRHYVARAGDYSQISLDLECQLGTVGAEEIDILGQKHMTRHLAETCISPEGGKVVNDYWIGAQDGILWKSRQWAGPRMGYVTFRQLVK